MMEIETSPVQKWLGVIASYDSEFGKWEARAKKILKRYRDDTRGQTNNETAKFNILWSNVQTLVPAVFARLPKADVSRRFGDNDPVGRVAATLVERALDFEIEHYPDFRAAMRYAVEDRFLPGRGIAWVRYEPHVTRIGVGDEGLQATEDVEGADLERIEYECAPADYVHWKDFGHSTARTWEEVTCVWRWVYMTHEALVERFGEDKAKVIPLDSGPEPLNAYNERKRVNNRAKICELWDKTTKRVFWFCKGYPQIIDEREDPLGLENFFPCPRPLYATTTSDTLVPVPDFTLYQDQAAELDILSDRIDGLVKALRVRGVYDASQPALQRLLTEGENNALIPVDKWMAFSEKGGLKGSVDLLPIDQIAGALIQCYSAREQIKGQIYEITGISDIIRGQTAASETATAQQIKGQYASLRLRSMQEDVALFATELLRLKAQIICTKFQPQTILAYAAAEQMSDADKAVIPQALELLQDSPLRNFRIDVAADSLVQIDEAQMKQDRMEFLQAFGGFMQQALPVAVARPEMAPVMSELMKFGVQAFKQARPLEGAIEQAMEQMKAAQGQPSPEQQAAEGQAQVEQQKAQVQMQLEQAKMQAAQQVESAKLQMEQQRIAAEQQAEAQRMQFEAQLKAQEMQNKTELEKWKANLDAQTKILVARISANPGVDLPNIEAQASQTQAMAQTVNNDLRQAMEGLQQMQAQQAQQYAETLAYLQTAMQAMYAPKRIVRGADGRAAGVEIVRDQQTMN